MGAWHSAGVRSARVLFSPLLDLIDGTQLTDLDIVCVMGGRVVVGESNDSELNFTRAKSDELIAAARLLRPDTVVLTFPDPAAIAVVRAQAENIRATLDDPRV